MQGPARGRLLVVEDDELVRELLGLAASDAGLETILARDDQAAMAAIEALDGDDLMAVVTDVELGGRRDGWLVAEFARAHLPDVPVVYVSGAGGHGWAKRGVSGSLFLGKPISPYLVIDAVLTLVAQAGRRPRSCAGF